MESQANNTHRHQDIIDRPEIREYLAGLKRRRATAHRLIPLEGGYKDPWTGF